MGSRANLILVENKQTTIYYDRHAGVCIDQYVFWGEKLLTEFIVEYHSQENVTILDNIWAEGGVVVDKDQRRLLFWGGDYLLFNLPLRQFYLDQMAKLWPGWQLVWASEGQFELLDYIGIEIAQQQTDSPSSYLKEMVPFESANVMVTTTENHLNQFYGFRMPGYFEVPPMALLTHIQQSPSSQQLFINSTMQLLSGLHLDINKQIIYYWFCQSAESRSLHELFANQWPGWTIVCWGSDFTQHFNQVNHRYFAVPDKHMLQQQLMELLCYQDEEQSVADFNGDDLPATQDLSQYIECWWDEHRRIEQQNIELPELMKRAVLKRLLEI